MVERKYKLRILRIMAIYSLIMLAMILFSLSFSKNRPSYIPSEDDTSHIPQTEYVYIKVEDNISDSESEEITDNIEKYIMREYMGKIGVFSEDGILLYSLDVYTKTLPEADRRLLREGIEIFGKKALNELIQDYDG